MSLYTIARPCAFTADGTGVYYRKVGAVVELDDTVAEGLGDAVSPVVPPKAKPTPVEPPPPIPEPEPEPEPVDELKSRRARRSDDG